MSSQSLPPFRVRAGRRAEAEGCGCAPMPVSSSSWGRPGGV